MKQSGSDLRAGASKVDITPDIQKIRIQLGGYGARMNVPPKGVHDPIYARVLVLQKGKQKLAIVSLDHLLAPGSLTREVLKAVKGTGIEENNLFMAATHTHCAPDAMGLNDRMRVFLPGVGSFIPEFLSFTAEKIAGAIHQANKRLKPCRFAVHAEALPGLNRNRRKANFLDPTMTVAKLTSTRNEEIAAIVVYAAHPTIHGHTMMQVSAEFPGVLQNGLEKEEGQGRIALFLNGAQGDVSPSADEGKDDFDRVQIYGEKLLSHARRLLNAVKREPDPVLGSVISTPLPEPRPHREFQESAGKEYKIPQAMLNDIVKRIAPPNAPVSLAKVGSLLLMGFPGEPISELGLNLKAYAQQKGAKHAAPVALVNDWVGYILTAAEYEKGGYEATVSFHGPDLGKAIEDAMKRGVDNMLKR